MVIKIDGPAPQLGLNITDYSHQMNADGHCLSWCTVDPLDLQVDGENITSILPRAGHLSLSAPQFSTGPRIAETAGFPSALFERDVLDYLATQTKLDGSRFSIAAVCDMEALLNSPQNIFSICSPKKNLRLLRQADGFAVKSMGKDIYVGENEWPKSRLFLAIMSASDRTLRVRIRDITKTGVIAEVPFENPNAEGCHVIFGAEQMGDATDTPTPSGPRSWRGHMLEMLVFESDILAGGKALDLLDKYVSNIYLGDAPRA